MMSDTPPATLSGEPESNDEAPAADPFLSLKWGAAELYLIRHGDALPSADDLVSGSSYDEQGLSDLGRRQAEALAGRMPALGLGAVYSSPIPRARQTADAIATASGLATQIDAELREVELGPIGRRPDAETNAADTARLLRERLLEIARVAVLSGTWSSIPGSEPSAQLRRRLTAAILRIAARHPGQRVAVVSHGGAINAYIAEILGIDRDYFFPAANTSVSMVRVKGQRQMLFALNDISHLREANLLTSDALS
jgi:broad specificity phosphatase PhoE